MAGVFTKLWSGPGMDGENFLYRVYHDSEGLGLGCHRRSFLCQREIVGLFALLAAARWWVVLVGGRELAFFSGFIRTVLKLDAAD